LLGDIRLERLGRRDVGGDGASPALRRFPQPRRLCLFSICSMFIFLEQGTAAMSKDPMREIIDSIVPPKPIFDGSEHDTGTCGKTASVSANAGGTSAGEREKLLPRQEQFCRHYVTQPVATRAAVLAGYAERSAYNQGHRLLKQAEV